MSHETASKIAMQNTKINVNEVQSIIQPLIGCEAWNARVGVGAFLLMEFGQSLPFPKVGKPNPRRPEPKIHEIGEWSLWIYMCQWRIEHEGAMIASAQSDTRLEIENAISRFNGKTIQSVDIEKPLGDTMFVFSDSYIIRTFSTSLDARAWSLRTPSGKHIIADPNEGWEYRS